MRAPHWFPFGARLLPTGGTRFRLWAPSCARVDLELIGLDGTTVDSRPMRRRGGGWHERLCDDVGAGRRYRYRVRADLAVPDPAARFNPRDVHGPSVVVDPRRYAWRDHGWRGRPWHEAVIYELHVGAFTAEGTFQAAAQKLAWLRDLGITAVELMPLAEFSGARNWGYDGVLPFAPDSSYGEPDDLKRFVDAAHDLGIMVLLDVVYNHFGPDGNYLSAYAPEFFNPEHPTPWGPAINFDGDCSRTVRRFFVGNALFWIDEFHLDGLRLDAVHAIRDESVCHVLAEIAAAVRRGPGRERSVHLVLENEENAARLLGRAADDQPAVAIAQWNDDLHNAAHVLATGETESYYRDFDERPAALLARALAEGFVYQGQPSRLHGGAPRGEPSTGLPATSFVAFLQNHDQVGNRALGERLDDLVGAQRVEALLACLLLAPQIPMLFMGEEFAASTPFLYFCDAAEGLAQMIRDGRRAEFAAFASFHDPSRRAAIPDPNDPATFAASKLDWRERDRPAGARRSQLVHSLLALRRTHLQPLLGSQRGPGTWSAGDRHLAVHWSFDDVVWSLRMNLAADPVSLPCARDEEVVLALRSRREDGASCLLQGDGVEIALRRGGRR
jgi:maltooligosyltrehalose trehalohydrolase